MKNKVVGLFSVCALVLVLIVHPSVSNAQVNKINYLALGDSLAAGQSYAKEFEDGYADYLAYKMDDAGNLASFSKVFATSGYTTEDVLRDINANVETTDATGKLITIQGEIAKAEMITISAGANDLLRLVKIDPQTNTVSYDQAQVMTGLQQIGNNTTAILLKIKAINPNAKVYIMGYYNAFPHLPVEMQTQLGGSLAQLDYVLQQSSAQVGAKFVPTSQAIGKNAKNYLPNPTDIHPNAAGYLVLANSFWKQIDLGNTTAFKDAIPNWAKADVNYLVNKGIIYGYQNGNFGANDGIKRLDAALIINRSIIFDFDKSANPGYADVIETSFGYDVIAKLSEYKIFNGSNGNFYPEKSLTRAEMAKVIVDAFGLQGVSDHTFTDVTDHWAASYITTLAANGITVGYEDGTFAPDNEISRAEFAAFIARAIKASK